MTRGAHPVAAARRAASVLDNETDVRAALKRIETNGVTQIDRVIPLFHILTHARVERSAQAVLAGRGRHLLTTRIEPVRVQAELLDGAPHGVIAIVKIRSMGIE